MDPAPSATPPQPTSHGSRRLADASRLTALITVVVVVGILYLAREVLIPIALAMLLCFVLAPLVNRVQRMGAHRIVAVIVVTAASFGAVAMVGWLVAGELVELAGQLSTYRENIRDKVRSLRLPGDSILGRASKNIEQIGQDVMEAASQPASQPGMPHDTAATARDESLAETVASLQEPQPVQVVEPPLSPIDVIRNTVSPILSPIGTMGIVIVFVIFMMLEREDLRDRLIRLAGESQLTATTQALGDAASRVSRYLLMMLTVAVIHGCLTATGLWMIGVPQALLWGALAVLLRFVPYIGPWIAAALPIALSLAVFETWREPLLVMGMFVLLELFTNNVLEPVLYGSGTGVSALAILVSAVFWTWLWGAPGLVLSTPLTVVLVVLGRHFPTLRFLAVLLSDEPGLPPDMRLYHRLLAMDHEAALTLSEAELKRSTPVELFESVFVPALIQSERDRHRGALEPDREAFISRSLRELIEELAEEDREPAPPTTPIESLGPVLCLPAHDEADETAAIMLVHLLQESGQPAQATAAALVAEQLDEVEKLAPRAVCISALPPLAVSRARYLAKRLAARFPDMPVVVGVWNASDPHLATQRFAVGANGSVQVVTSFTQALERLRT